MALGDATAGFGFRETSQEQARSPLMLDHKAELPETPNQQSSLLPARGKYPKYQFSLPILERIPWDRTTLLASKSQWLFTEWLERLTQPLQVYFSPPPRKERGWLQGLGMCTEASREPTLSEQEAGRAPTCVASQGRSRDDRLVLVEVSTVTHIVLEGALGLVVGQGGWVVLWVEAVVGRDALQAVEGWLAAPGLREAVAAIVALYALKGVLAPELAWRKRRWEEGREEGWEETLWNPLGEDAQDGWREWPVGMEACGFALGRRGCLGPVCEPPAWSRLAPEPLGQRCRVGRSFHLPEGDSSVWDRKNSRARSLQAENHACYDGISGWWIRPNE